MWTSSPKPVRVRLWGPNPPSEPKTGHGSTNRTHCRAACLAGDRHPNSPPTTQATPRSSSLAVIMGRTSANACRPSPKMTNASARASLTKSSVMERGSFVMAVGQLLEQLVTGNVRKPCRNAKHRDHGVAEELNVAVLRLEQDVVPLEVHRTDNFLAGEAELSAAGRRPAGGARPDRSERDANAKRKLE